VSPPEPPPSLTLYGAGRLGTTLARLWADAGTFAIADVVTRHRASAEAAAAFVGQGRPRLADEALAPADAILLAVPDDALPGSARALAERDAVGDGTLAFHCSGALDAGLLAPLRDRGARVASAHPMHSFAEPARSLQTFRGSCCALEGDPDAVAQLTAAFAAIGGIPVRIRGEAKLLYHAAGVFVANYVTTLVDAATRLAAAAGFAPDAARDLLAPLLRGAVESALALGPEAALTGPVARGDTGLVARQAAAVAEHDPTLGALYRVLGTAAADLARRGGQIDAATAAALHAALDAAAHRNP